MAQDGDAHAAFAVAVVIPTASRREDFHLLSSEVTDDKIAGLALLAIVNKVELWGSHGDNCLRDMITARPLLLNLRYMI